MPLTRWVLWPRYYSTYNTCYTGHIWKVKQDQAQLITIIKYGVTGIQQATTEIYLKNIDDDLAAAVSLLEKKTTQNQKEASPTG